VIDFEDCTMQKFAINTVLWTWPFAADRLDLLQRVRDFGYSAVEFAIEDMSPPHLEKIKAEVDRLGLETIICGAFGPDRSLIDPSGKVRRNGLEYVRGLLKVCRILGAKTIVGPTYSLGIHEHVLEPEGRKAAEDRFVESLKELAPEVEDTEVRIAIEPLNRYESNFLNLGSDVLRLVEEVSSPAIGLHLDPYHMNIEEPGFAGPIEKAGRKLYHFHICENDRGVPGTGTIRWDEIASALKRIGYDHYLSVECCDPEALGPEISRLAAVWRAYDESPDKIARDSLAFLRCQMN